MRDSRYTAWLHGKPATCSGHDGCLNLTDIMPHMAAIGSKDPADESRYDMLLLALYHDAKAAPHACFLCVAGFARIASAIAASYKDEEMKDVPAYVSGVLGHVSI